MLNTLHTTSIKLPDSSGDNYFNPVTITMAEFDNRLELTLPDGQILALEQFLGETRLIHWSQPNDDTIEPTIVPLITPDE